MNQNDQNYLTSLGKQLKARRLYLRYKQKDIARKCLINPRTLGNIEAGRNWPSLLVYWRLCRALQMPVTPPFSIPSV